MRAARRQTRGRAVRDERSPPVAHRCLPCLRSRECGADPLCTPPLSHFLWLPCTACSHRRKLSNAAKMALARLLCPLRRSVHRWPFLAPRPLTPPAVLSSGLNSGLLDNVCRRSSGAEPTQLSLQSGLLVGVRLCRLHLENCMIRNRTLQQLCRCVAQG